MDIYLDCADSSQWTLPAGCPPVVGVTTNPSLVFQAGLSVSLATYRSLVDAAGAHGMAQFMVHQGSVNCSVGKFRHVRITDFRQLQGCDNQQPNSFCVTVKFPVQSVLVECVGDRFSALRAQLP